MPTKQKRKRASKERQKIREGTKRIVWERVCVNGKTGEKKKHWSVKKKWMQRDWQRVKKRGGTALGVEGRWGEGRKRQFKKKGERKKKGG